MSTVAEVTARDFESVVLESATPVIVDFWAPWCGPCQLVGPEIERLAVRVRGGAKFVKVNVDDNGELAMQYGVMSIPTIAKFENGGPVAQVVGAQSAEELARAFGLT